MVRSLWIFVFIRLYFVGLVIIFLSPVRYDSPRRGVARATITITRSEYILPMHVFRGLEFYYINCCYTYFLQNSAVVGLMSTGQLETNFISNEDTPSFLSGLWIAYSAIVRCFYKAGNS